MAHILIIEDNQDIRENLSEILELAGFKTTIAQNGREGVRKVREFRPDLILCDIMMPELDGYGVLHILSKDEETLGIPFIFLTAKAEKTDIRLGMSLGADDYITKPFDETDLLRTIENRLNRSRAFAPGPVVDNDKLFENKQVKSLSTKELIYREGDTASWVYYLESGKLKLTKMNKEGKEVVLELCGGGDFFGYWAVLHEGLHSNSAECLEECKIWLIPADDFKNSLFNNSEISGQFLKALTKNLLIKEHKILDLAYESVRKRVAKALVELQSAYETKGEARMKVSRETIASMAGTSVETAIRMISEFKSDGLIDVQGSEIRVRDPDKLAKLPF